MLPGSQSFHEAQDIIGEASSQGIDGRLLMELVDLSRSSQEEHKEHLRISRCGHA